MLKSDCVVVSIFPDDGFHPFRLDFTCLSMLISKSLNFRPLCKGGQSRFAPLSKRPSKLSR